MNLIKQPGPPTYYGCQACHRTRGIGETLRGWVLAPVTEDRAEGAVRCVRWYCPACATRLPPAPIRTGGRR